VVEGGLGDFEIMVDGRLAFSKQQTGRFPTDDEVDALAHG
jgi:predicted Rdx family selenoprotein